MLTKTNPLTKNLETYVSKGGNVKTNIKIIYIILLIIYYVRFKQ